MTDTTTATENTCAEYADALDVLERYTTKAELLGALWLLLRLQHDRPMAVTLTLLVHQLNTIRRMNGDENPIRVPVNARALRDDRSLAAERVALACASAMGLEGQALF